MIYIIRLVVLLACLLGFQSVSVAESTVLKGSSALAVSLSALSKLQGFSCQFKQELRYAEGGERVYLGELAVLRPGKFRWFYTKPYEQLYVSNGHGIWLYEPDLMQAQRMQSLGDVKPIVLQLLDGRIGLEDISVLDTELQTDGISVWHVRMGQGNQSVEVWLGTENKTLRWIESKDVLFNKNRLNLLHINKSAPDESIFEFVAPKGVDVIGVLE